MKRSETQQKIKNKDKVARTKWDIYNRPVAGPSRSGPRSPPNMTQFGLGPAVQLGLQRG